MIRKIVIACDSFKGCLSSEEVARAVAAGVRRVIPGCIVESAAVADGGEGTSRVLTRCLGGRTIRVEVSDPLGRRITAEYGIADMETYAGIRTAIIDMAQASGLTLLTDDERNPLYTSTYGTGEMILDALGKGCRRFLIGSGGSATNDGGTGMLEALGVRFLDMAGNEIRNCCGGKLGSIRTFDESRIEPAIKESVFTVACDVNTAFCGEEGATKIFAPQKGASDKDMEILESGMRSLNGIIREAKGMDLSQTEGAGAAGGLGGAFIAFLNAEPVRGVDLVLDSIGFDEMIKDADLVITGEGRIDSQSCRGKLINGVAERAGRLDIPVLAIGGMVDPINTDDSGKEGMMPRFMAIRRIAPRPQSKSDLEHLMRPEVASQNISDTVAKALAELFPSSCHESL